MPVSYTHLIVYLAEIYAAREKNTIGISSADLAAQIPGAKFYPTFAEIDVYKRQALHLLQHVRVRAADNMCACIDRCVRERLLVGGYLIAALGAPMRSEDQNICTVILELLYAGADILILLKPVQPGQ